MRHRIATIAAVALLGLAHAAVAAKGTFSGYVGAELRGFPDEPQFPGQFEGFQPSLIASPEYRYRTANNKNHFAIVPFLRIDGRDDERTHFDLREAFWRRVGSDWELLIGVSSAYIRVDDGQTWELTMLPSWPGFHFSSDPC